VLLKNPSQVFSLNSFSGYQGLNISPPTAQTSNLRPFLASYIMVVVSTTKEMNDTLKSGKIKLLFQMA